MIVILKLSLTLTYNLYLYDMIYYVNLHTLCINRINYYIATHVIYVNI